MTAFLAGTTITIALGIQTALMWRLDRRAGRERCEFLAFVWTMVIIAVEGTLLHYVFPHEAAATPHSAFWLFAGNGLLYQTVGLAGLKEDSKFMTKYDLYGWLFGGCIIAIGLLLAKYVP